MFSLTTTRMIPPALSPNSIHACHNVLFDLVTVNVLPCHHQACHHQAKPPALSPHSIHACHNVLFESVTVSVLSCHHQAETPLHCPPHSIHACHNVLFERVTVNVLPYHHQTETPCIVATLHPRLSQCRHTPSTLVTMSCLNVSLSMFTLTTRLKPPALSPHSIHACHNVLFERVTVNVLPYHHQAKPPALSPNSIHACHNVLFERVTVNVLPCHHQAENPLHCRHTPSTLVTMFCLNVSLSMFSLTATRLKRPVLSPHSIHACHNVLFERVTVNVHPYHQTEAPCIVTTLHPRLSQWFDWTWHCQCSPLPPPGWYPLYCRHTPSTLVTMSCLNVSL